MKFFKNKKVIAGVLGTAIMFSGATVYATTALDTNVLNLIRMTVGHVGGLFTSEAQKEVKNFADAKKNEMNQYIDVRTNQAIDELQSTKTSEVSRAKGELTLYYNDVKNETDRAFTTETNKVKAEIKNATDHEIANGKVMIDGEVEKALEEKLKELKGNGNNNGNNGTIGNGQNK